MHRDFHAIVIAAALVTATSALSGCQTISGASKSARDSGEAAGKVKNPSLLTVRDGFTPHFTVEEPVGDGEPPSTPPPDIYELVHYKSPAGELAAYVSPDPGDGEKHPAVIWSHGGFGCIGAAHWRRKDLTAAYREAGFIVMVPSWRGECDNPGFFELFYGEVEDAVAAVEYTRSLSYVDPDRVYMVGHSSGGTIALLTAAATDKLRAVVSLGGNADIQLLLSDGEGYGNTPFPVDNKMASGLRSARQFVQYIETPTYSIEGSAIEAIIWAAEAMEVAGRKIDAPFKSFVVEGGDHFDHLRPTNQLIAAEFAKDTGAEPDLDISQRRIQRAYDAYYDRDPSWNVDNEGLYQEEACRRGSASACYMAGWHLYHGNHGPQDIESSIEFMERACQMRGWLCGIVGVHLLDEVGTDDAKRRARPLLAKACENEDARNRTRACFETGFMNQRGIGGPIDFEAAIEPLQTACFELDHGHSCHFLGVTYAAARGVEEDQERAALLYVRACSMGYWHGCGDAAYRLSQGLGVEQDERRAFDLVKSVCAESSDPYSCRMLGTFYIDGTGTKRDYRRAYELLAQVCDEERGFACEMAAVALERQPNAANVSPQTFYKRAEAAYENMCENKHDGRACRNLADLYKDGHGVEVGAERAAELEARACELDPRECPDE